jgi:hypothetical protein
LDLSLPSGLVIPLKVLLALVPGILIIRRFLPPRTPWNLPLFFAALTLGMVWLGWSALVLAELGRFGLGSFMAVWGLVAAGLLVWEINARQAAPDPMVTEDEVGGHSGEGKWPIWEWLVLAAWLFAAIWLFFRPHEYILGGADAGVYINLGAEIAQHGSFRIIDPSLAELAPAFRDSVLRPLPNTPGASSYLLPGFYVANVENGAITPQFYPLHPIFQSIAFALAGNVVTGVRAELLLTGLWMLLGSLAVYLHARDIGGPVMSVLALAALSLTGLTVWFARYPTSEAAALFLLWAGLWAGSRWLTGQSPARLWAFTAGIAFGAFFLLRIDSIILLPVFVVLLVGRWARGWRVDDTWFAMPLVLLFVHSLLHGHFLSAPYFYETLSYAVFLLDRLWPLLVAAVFVAAALLWRLHGRTSRWSGLSSVRRPVLGLLIAGVLAFAFYGWFFRPALGETFMRPDVFSDGEIPVTNHENWPRLGWYLTPLGVWLGIFGSCLLLWRVNYRTALTLAIGFLFMGLYLWNISANPHQVYVMRRYVPAVVPFLTLSAAYLLSRGIAPLIGSKLTRPGKLKDAAFPLLSAAITLVWLGGLIWAARGFVSQIDHAGLTGQLDSLAGRLPSGAVLLFNDQSPVSQGDTVGTPLKFLYGHDVFTLRRADVDQALIAEAVTMWQNSNRQIVWIGDPSRLEELGYNYQTETVTLETRRLESSYVRKPQSLVTNTVILDLHFVE